MGSDLQGVFPKHSLGRIRRRGSGHLGSSVHYPGSVIVRWMNHYTLWHALIGGMLIGLASLIATGLSGKVPGISGVFGRLLVPATPDKSWRLVFLIGLIGGAALSFALWDSAALFRPMRSLGVMAVAGLLVGFGTRLGGGCTSGHGVCGVGTGQKDSLAATLIFMAVAILTVFIYNHAVL
jgi:uncharacterized protein